MTFWRRDWWLRTVSAQIVIFTTAAVLFSNLAVGLWFETTQQLMTEASITERVADRAASTATLLSTIPAREREAAVRTMSTGPWHFELAEGQDLPQPMTDEEAKLAQRVRSLLQPQRARYPVTVHLRTGSLPLNPGHVQPESRNGSLIVMTLPVVRNKQLIATFLKSPSPIWPVEVMVASAVALLTTFIAATVVSRRVARPLARLAESAAQAARGGPAPRVPEEGPDDVRRAARAFNAMTDQVTRTMESQRQLLSAVGHDLRTPITAMRINTEFVDDPEIRQRLETNLEELQDLTEAVLSAARGVGWGTMRKIDLAALVESLCSDLDEMGEPVFWEAHSAAPFICRPNEIRRALRNLIHNAIAYGQRAQVRLREAKDRYEIMVEDDGPGIPQADLKRVFEPFVRLEASRSAETGGTGLGLTLVKAITEGHGGTIHLENRTEGGLRVRLRLPREVAPA